MKRSTIKEVSAKAGVSVATVSRVINRSKKVNADTKLKVEEAIRELEYQPNEIARDLFVGNSKIIALFVPDITNPFFPELARAVEDTANKNGYTFVLCNTDNNPKKEEEYLNALLKKYISGIVLVSSTIDEQLIKNSDIPIVSLDRVLNTELPSVTVDNYHGAIEAVRYLKSLGCRKIAHIKGIENASSSKERLRGYLDVVSKESWFKEEYVIDGDYNMITAREKVRNFLIHIEEVDGIFAANDTMGISCINAAEELSINVPQELCIIGFDGISTGEITNPTLTTIAQPIYEMGKYASRILVNKDHKKNQHKQFGVKLIKRRSTR